MKKHKQTKTEKKDFLHYSGWIVGIIFVIWGMSEFSESFGIGLLYILAGLIIIPYTNILINQKFEINLPRWLRIALFLVILGFAGNMESSEIVQSTPVIQPSQKQILIDSKERVDEKEQETVSEEKEIIEKEGTPTSEVQEKQPLIEEEPPAKIEDKKTKEQLETEKLIEQLEDRYNEATKVLTRDYFLTSTKCLDFCEESEKLWRNDFGVPPKDDDFEFQLDMSSIEDLCKSDCRYAGRDIYVLINMYRSEILESLEILKEDIEYLKTGGT